MGDFEPPSFSLGFDFDFDDTPEPQITSNRVSEYVPLASAAANVDINGEEFEIETLTVADSDDEDDVARPRLKRLRRGCSAVDVGLSGSGKGKSTVDLDLDFGSGSGSGLEKGKSTVDLGSGMRTVDLGSCSGSGKSAVALGSCSGSGKRTVDLGSCSGSVVVDDDDIHDDDIEDFSAPEDNIKDEILPTPHYSVSNTSKFPLTGLGVLTRESGKRKQNLSNISNAPESVITSCSKQPFPKLTVSPLRKFQLIDSDSDSDIPSISNKTCSKSNSYLDRGKSVDLHQPRKDLWEDFSYKKSFHIPTPALDEVCAEYFSSIKDKNNVQNNIGKSNNNSHLMDSVVVDLGDPRPPAHQYFFHNDMRIQDLVRTRLCNFFPLNAENSGSELPGTSNIDYMGQFSSGDKPKQAARTSKAETSSSRKNSRKSKAQETSQGFMNPKVNTAGVTKDAGKRRVQADGQATGHWFTNGDGKRVYVAKNGQEMTGKAAYIHYKKESGGGFKKNFYQEKMSVNRALKCVMGFFNGS